MLLFFFILGKIDDTALRIHIENDKKLSKFSGTVFDFLRTNPEIQQSNETIASLGFGSRDLFEFIFEVTQHSRQQFGNSDKQAELRKQLFDQKTPASYLFYLIGQCQLKDDVEVDESFVEFQMVDKFYEVKLIQKFAMKKCVDFTPEFWNE